MEDYRNIIERMENAEAYISMFEKFTQIEMKATSDAMAIIHQLQDQLAAMQNEMSLLRETISSSRGQRQDH